MTDEPGGIEPAYLCTECGWRGRPRHEPCPSCEGVLFLRATVTAERDGFSFATALVEVEEPD